LILRLKRRVKKQVIGLIKIFSFYLIANLEKNCDYNLDAASFIQENKCCEKERLTNRFTAFLS